ncbi:hypothetical protein DL771_002359 [Monosporascus sp. 5C6A]|nr:hypothetical protein DL771_002359 [Monosporascus sp. 5C6A]
MYNSNNPRRFNTDSLIVTYRNNPLKSMIAQLRPLPYPTTDCTRKVVIVTGANSGLGLEAARNFVRLNVRKVILGCGDLSKGSAAKAAIKKSEEKSADTGATLEVWRVDMASFASAEEFCRRAAELERLDTIIANAGIQTAEYGSAEGTPSHGQRHLDLTARVAAPADPAAAGGSRRSRQVDLRWHEVRGEHFAAVRHEQAPGRARRPGAGDTHRELAAPRHAEHGRPRLRSSQLFRNALFPKTWVVTIALRLWGRTPETGSRALVAAALGGTDAHGDISKIAHWDPAES